MESLVHGRCVMTRGSRRLGLCVAIAACLVASATHASEGGASVYLLGSGGPGAAVLPPIDGVFFFNTAYHYDGKAGGNKQFLVSGNLVAGLKGNINADFATVLFIPTTDFAGGVLALGAALPVGVPAVDVSAVITGPRGRTVAISRSDDRLIVGDPLVTAAWGWTSGKTHIALSGLVNIPIGQYSQGRLSNLSFHRWAGDVSLAATWLDEERGWDLSGKAGFTFNGENPATDYRTGTEFHVEGAIEKQFSPTWSLGLQAYYFSQVSGDSGAGDTLGPFKGEVGGVGVTGAYNFKIADKIPATLRLHAMTEFDAKNRLEGNSVWLDFSMPLWVKTPPRASGL